MDDFLLEVKNVSKQFALHEHGKSNLKELIAYALSGKKNNNKIFIALDHVSFQLKKGEALGIIGKNGAGKSTLLKILSGVTSPNEGEVNFYGKAVSILDVGAGFHPELTGRENIYLSAPLYNYSRKEIDTKFNDIVDFSGIENFIDEPVKNYSAGMYLRLAFSIIAFLEADIYLLDEVINVGDANFQNKCKIRLQELLSAGKSLLISSHNLNEILSLCNRIVLLENGRIIETGGTEVIQKYLSQSLPHYSGFTHENFFSLEEIPGAAKNLKGISLLGWGLSEFIEAANGINISSPLKIYLEIQLEKTDHYAIRLKFFDSTGVMAFGCSTLNQLAELKQAGNYRVEFTIPANILNERMYHADITVGNSSTQEVLWRADKFLTFKMANESNGENSPFQRDSLQGIVKPAIATSIFKIQY